MLPSEFTEIFNEAGAILGRPAWRFLLSGAHDPTNALQDLTVTFTFSGPVKVFMCLLDRCFRLRDDVFLLTREAQVHDPGSPIVLPFLFMQSSGLALCIVLTGASWRLQRSGVNAHRKGKYLIALIAATLIA